jgi:hypothetical protein
MIFDVTSAAGCTITDSISVAVSSSTSPIAVITGDSTVCVGDSNLLTVVITNNVVTDDFNTGISSSLWASNTGVDNTSCGSMRQRAAL